LCVNTRSENMVTCTKHVVLTGPPCTPTIQNISSTIHSIVVLWIECFHGGFDQTVHIEIKSDISEWSERSSKLLFTYENVSPRNFTINNLEGGMAYQVRLFASNERGNSDTSEVWTITTKGTQCCITFNITH